MHMHTHTHAHTHTRTHTRTHTYPPTHPHTHRYTESAVQLGSTYKLMKPHMEFLLCSVIFPILCLSDADLELFDADPIEYARKENDPMEEFFDPKVFVWRYALLLVWL